MISIRCRFESLLHNTANEYVTGDEVIDGWEFQRQTLIGGYCIVCEVLSFDGTKRISIKFFSLKYKEILS